MALPQNQSRIAPPGRQAVVLSAPSFVKTYASPGIDSGPAEFGIFVSGAAQHPITRTFKVNPWDWFNESASQGYSTEKLVGGFSATQAPTVDTLKIRRRGVSPFGGMFMQHPHSLQHPGGIADLNPGADYRIAGGKGQASSMVRVSAPTDAMPNRGMKLPTLPRGASRGGVANIPTGGTFDSSPAVPLMPKIAGWPTIFSFRMAAP